MSSAATRRVRLLYFAWVREKIGCPEESVELPASVATVADLVTWLKDRGYAIFQYTPESMQFGPDGVVCQVDW